MTSLGLAQGPAHPMSKSFSPDKIVGRTYLLPPNEEGERLRATITKKITDKQANVEEERIKYLVKYGKNKSTDEVMEVDEEIVAYNVILDCIEARHMTEIDNLDEGETWKFKEIRGHQGPLTPKDMT